MIRLEDAGWLEFRDQRAKGNNMIPKVYRSIGALSALVMTLSSCGDNGDAIAMHLQVSVRSLDGEPVNRADVWLKDFYFEDGAQPSYLQEPVCTTNRQGKCSVELRYSSGHVDQPWTRFLRHKPSLPERFEVSVKKDGHLLVRQRISSVTAPQIQGKQKITIDLRLPGQRSEER